MYYYIINPAAGHGAAHDLQDKLRTELKALGIGGEFVMTTGPGDATKLASQAASKGYTTIVAVGGDDTVNEVINGVISDTAAVGVLPIGKHNLLAAQLGIVTWQQGAAVLASRRISEYALIAAGDDFFLSSLTIGFENEVAESLPPSGLKHKVAHWRETLKRSQVYEPIDCHINVDSAYTVHAKAFSLSVTNQKFLSPTAPNELAVSIAERPSKRQLGSLLIRSGHREALDELANTHFHGKYLKIESTPEVNVAIDGKFVSRTPLTIHLTDRRIRLIVEKPAA